MKTLYDCKDDVHSCSKCGLCQSVCPIYKITGNDCTVSRGHFIMLRGVINGELKMTKKINRYLDLCLKCGACTKFCPSGIDVVDIVALAKAEYFKNHPIEKVISFIQKYFVLGFGKKMLSLFSKRKKSKSFDKKVLLYTGCGKYASLSAVKILNSLNIETVMPNFDCCGMPFFVRGDMDNFKECMSSFFSKLDAYGISEVVTTCASCEKMLKSYSKWSGRCDYVIKNIYEYIKENNLTIKLKEKTKVTYHKPCNASNFVDIEWILNNTKNLEYVQMEDYDKCCGFNGIGKPSEYNIMLKLYADKRNKVLKTGAKILLTSCLGCLITLKIFSRGKYKVRDLAEFLSENVE
ncbi:(Fe-S)-binding protein, partial [bacterium]|nr:(Fe-S)-binding protein [bacterium]